MWCTAIVAFIGIVGVLSLGHAEEPSTNQTTMPLDSFDTDQPGSFPGQWAVRGDEVIAKAMYSVVEENGNRFLRVHADKQDAQIGISRTFKPKQFPALRWRWRVKQLPTGADERAKETNDSAAGVYVVFDSTVMPRAIKYVWSSSLPVGTRMDSPTYWRAKVIVLKSGVAAVGEWRKETVNFYEDYKKLFGFEPSEVVGVALLTDSDTTATVAEADYDDFTLLDEGAASEMQTKEAMALLSTLVMPGK